MAVNDQVVTKNYAIYEGDCIEVMAEMPASSVDLSISRSIAQRADGRDRGEPWS